MPLSLADLFAYQADEAIRTVLTLNFEKIARGLSGWRRNACKRPPRSEHCSPPLMSKTYLKSDHFNGGGSTPAMGARNDPISSADT
jgi:hypothetical protein